MQRINHKLIAFCSGSSFRNLTYTRRQYPFRPFTTSSRVTNSTKNSTNLSHNSFAEHEMASISDDDEFPFSQEDAEALLEAEAQALDKKRKFKEEDETQSKKPCIESYPTTSPAAVAFLQKSFGKPGFRLKQEAVISRVLAGGSAAVVFPTGGGKSLCFQIPALLFEDQDKKENSRPPGEHGVSIVVSPLISLMKDQVDALMKRGLSARCLDSTKSREEVADTHEMLQNGTLKLLYCAPERLNNEGFVHRMAQVRGGVRLVAVDEAHCISQWGHAFRPDYLKVARFAEEIGAERVVCLTATATPRVAQDICDAFKIGSGGLFRTSSYRPNLQILVEGAKTKQELYPRLFKFLRENPGPSIVYVTLQKQTEVLADDLRDQGFNAEPYHAGLNAAVKTELQERFLQKDNLIIVATIAFGMGIDKDNVRNIVHFNIPSSIESYSQEIGRAGRDGKPSKVLFYVCGEDLYLRENFARGDVPSKESLRGLLREIWDSIAELDKGELLKVSHYQQGKEYDIRATTLNNIYAQLELTHGLLRATTPEYTSYTYKAGSDYKSTLQNDKSLPAQAIKAKVTFGGKTVYTVDVNAAALAFSDRGVTRADIIRKLNDWNDTHAIDLTTSGVANVYRILTKLPDLESVVDDLYTLMEEREQQALDRTEEMLDLMTSAGCYTAGLARHFGDELPGGKKECGHCSWCKTRTRVPRQDPGPVPFDHAAFNRILKEVPDRDDARFLTRIAFGITSPRITAMRLSRAPGSIFMSMADHGFMTLLDAFTAECNKPGVKKEGITASAPPSKTASSRGSSSRGRGGATRGYSTRARGRARGYY